MILSAKNRRIRAEDVIKLKDGSIVTIRCDQRSINRKLGTKCYKVVTIKGLKVLSQINYPYEIKTIKERPGQYFCRENNKNYRIKKPNEK